MYASVIWIGLCAKEGEDKAMPLTPESNAGGTILGALCAHSPANI